MKHAPTLRSRLTAGLAIASLAASPLSLHATDLYWGGWTNGTAAWSTAGNWYTDAAETSASGAAPTAADDLFFNTTADNALGGTITLSGNIAANSLTHNTSGATVISHVTGEKTLTLGAGGITMNSGAGALTLGISSGALWTETIANQTWTNNSSSDLAVRRLRASSSVGAPALVQLTLNAAGTGAITFSNSIGDSKTGGKALALVIDSTGTGVVNLAGPATGVNNQPMSGGTTINRGTVATSASSLGSGSVTFNATTGNTATLRLGSAAAYANDIVANASGGTQVLEFTGASGTQDGDVLLNGSLDVGVRLSGATGVTINGVISGNGDLIKGQYQGGDSGLLILAGINTHSGDTTISNGAFTLADNAALTFYIGANGVNNRVNGGGTNTATFDGDFIIDATGASLVDGNSWQLVDVDTLNESFSASFTVQGFSETDNIWSNGTGLLFDESSGFLSYVAIPEPSSWTLIASGAALLFCAQRRRRSA